VLHFEATRHAVKQCCCTANTLLRKAAVVESFLFNMVELHWSFVNNRHTLRI